MALITVTSGGPDIEAGTYPATLADLQARRITLTDTGEERDVFDWHFAIDVEGSDTPVIVNTLSSQSMGPRSKLYRFLSALLGRAPEVGENFEREDLIGKEILVLVGPDQKSGFMKAVDIMPRPKVRQTVRQQAQTAPAAPAAQDVAEDDLPF